MPYDLIYLADLLSVPAERRINQICAVSEISEWILCTMFKVKSIVLTDQNAFRNVKARVRMMMF